MDGDTVPIVLGVDVEPDERYPAEPAPWRGFDELVPFLERARGRLRRATGAPARLSWFLRMDTQIEQVYGAADWGVRRYARELERLRSRGDEVGVHPHVVRIADGAPVMDHGNPDAVRDAVETSLGAYRSAMGEPCRIHRGGDRMMSDDWVAILDRSGVEVDLTIEPGEPGTDTVDRGARWTGAIPDYSDAPREAYRPGGRFLHRGGAARVAMMPLTSARVPRSDRRRRAPGALPPGPPFRQLVPWHCEDPREFWDVAQERLAEMERPYLAFAVRSDIRMHPPEWGCFRDVLRVLSRHPIRRRLRFVTPTEAAALLGV